MLHHKIYNAETGETTEVEFTPAEVEEFNARLAAHESAQAALIEPVIEEQQPNEGE